MGPQQQWVGGEARLPSKDPEIILLAGIHISSWPFSRTVGVGQGYLLIGTFL